MQKNITHIAALYLLLLMVIKLMLVPAICLNYTINKAFITSNYCQNAGSPQLRCYGKCYLNKELAKAHEAGTSSKSTYIENRQDYFELWEYPLVISVIEHNNSFLHSRSIPIANGFPDNIFHPPGNAGLPG